MIKLKDLLTVTRKYWYYFVASIIIIVAAFALYAEFALPTYYESSTRIYCFAVNEEQSGGDEKNANAYTDKFAASHAIAMLSSGGFYYELYDTLTEPEKAKISVNELKESVSYNLYSGELNIVDVKCASADNEFAQKILINLNALIESKLKKLPFENTEFTVLVDEAPSLNRIPITAPKDKYYIYALLISVLASAAELAFFSYRAYKNGLISSVKAVVSDGKSDGKIAINN